MAKDALNDKAEGSGPVHEGLSCRKGHRGLLKTSSMLAWVPSTSSLRLQVLLACSGSPLVGGSEAHVEAEYSFCAGGLSVRMFNQERSNSSDQVEVRLTSGEAQHSVVRRPNFASATACVSMSGLWLVGGDGAVAAELCGLLLLALTRPL